MGLNELVQARFRTNGRSLVTYRPKTPANSLRTAVQSM